MGCLGALTTRGRIFTVAPPCIKPMSRVSTGPAGFPNSITDSGEPTFHHYSPGLYWLTVSAHRVGFRLDQSLKLVVTVALVLSGFGAYAWLRHAFSPAASLVGVALYLLHPHILTRSLYYVGDYPRLLVYLFLPICMWACTALYMKFRLRYWVAMAISLAALMFSHTLTALLSSIILVLYSLLLTAGYRRPGGLLRCAGAMLLGGLLSASFWLPALADLSLVQIGNLQEGYYHFSKHFLSWWEFFSLQTPVLDSRAGNPLAPVRKLGFDAASWLTLAAGIVSVLVAARREHRVWGLAGALFAVASLALTLQVSEPLWHTMPGLSLLQFPFRFLSIAPLGLLPAAALSVDVWPAGRRWLPGLSLIIASFLVLFPYLFPAHTSSIPPVAAKTAEEARLFEKKDRLWGTTGNNEFLTRDADLSVVTGQKPEPNAASLTWRTPHEASALLSGQTEPILLRLHYHPGWSAGERAVLTPGAAGWVQVTELSNPDQPLKIRWKGTPWQLWGESISLVGLLIIPAGLFYSALRRRTGGKRRTERETSPTSQSAAPHPTTYTLGALVGCVFILTAVHGTFNLPSNGPYLLRSRPGQLAFAVEGQPVTLGDAAESQVKLLGWEQLSSENPKSGGMVRVRLYWQPHGRISEELFSFLHLYAPSLKRSWAIENIKIARPPSHLWDPEKYYIEDIRLILPSDLPPVRYSLVAGLVTSNGDRLKVPGSTDNMLHLRTLNISPTRPSFFQRERPAIVARADTGDGLFLQGYDLFSEAGAQSLSLFWDTGDGVANDWITYIHLHDPRGERVAQFDGPALAGLQPTSRWHPNALYIDRRRLDLPYALKPGTYLLRVGLYSIASGVRLPFLPAGEGQDHFENGQLLIPFTVLPAG